MKIFQNKGIFKKLVIVFIFITILSFCMPKATQAEGGIGGILIDPILSLFVGLGDGAISLLHKMVLHTDASIIEIDSSVDGIAKILGVIVAATVVVAGVVAVVASGGTALAIMGSVLTVLKAGAVAGIVTFCAGTAIAGAILPEDFVLPQIKLSPYEIFANQVPLFNVDYFNPMEDTVVTEEGTRSGQNFQSAELTQSTQTLYTDQTKYNLKFGDDIEASKTYITNNISLIDQTTLNKDFAEAVKDAIMTTYHGFQTIGASSSQECYNSIIGSKYYRLTMNIDNGVFQNAKYEIGDVVVSGATTTTIESTAKKLQKTISNWYIILRDIALVSLLSILVYVGIRIVISSTASDKSKYKQMLIDWVVAICLLFLMHYIMAFSNIIVKKIISLIDMTTVQTTNESLPSEVSGKPIAQEGFVSEKGPQLFIIDEEKRVKKAYEVLVKEMANTNLCTESETEFYGNFEIVGGEPKKLRWPTTNFTEQARLMLQFVDDDENATKYAYTSIGWKIIYCVLVIYTFIFAFTYLKRTIYMAFLTLIAPLVALTYPIDKMNDGKAQAFDKWIKEYIFNLLIQPLHLILYMILVGAAMDFASQNIIYVVIALGFMTQGEKLLRSFFGFEKAHTPGLLGGPAGAAIMMGGINKLLRKPPNKSGGDAKGSNKQEVAENNKINYSDKLDTSSLYNADGKNEIGKGEDQEKIASQTENNSDNKNQRGFFEEDEDPALKDPNYMYMHPDEYDDNGNYLGKQNGLPKLENTKSNNTNPIIRTSQRSNSNNIRTPAKRSVIRGFKGVGNRIRMQSANQHYGKRLLSAGTGLAGAAVAATAAGLVGITSGDPAKAIQGMSAAGLGGYSLGKRIPSGIQNQYGNAKEYATSFKEGYYTDEEYKAKQQAKAFKEMKKDINFENDVGRVLENKELAREAIETVGEDCAKYGLTDANDVAATYQAYNESNNMQDALRQVKLAKRYGKDTSDLGAKDSKDLNETIMQRIRKNSRDNISEKEVMEHAKQIRSKMDSSSKILFKK